MVEIRWLNAHHSWQLLSSIDTFGLLLVNRPEKFFFRFFSFIKAAVRFVRIRWLTPLLLGNLAVLLNRNWSRFHTAVNCSFILSLFLLWLSALLHDQFCLLLANSIHSERGCVGCWSLLGLKSGLHTYFGRWFGEARAFLARAAGCKHYVSYLFNLNYNYI